MDENSDQHRRITSIEADVKNLQEAIYGDRNFPGLFTRIQITETKLQVFWWVLGTIGTGVIAVFIQMIARFFKS